MRGLLGLTLFIVAGVTFASREKDCNTLEMSYALRACEFKVIVNNSKSENLTATCPLAYKEGKQCLEEAFEICYMKNTQRSSVETYHEKELEIFGDQQKYCEQGGLRSIGPYVAAMTDQERARCKDNVTVEMVEKCESPFYQEFQRDPSSSNMSLLYEQTHICQESLLRKCHLSLNLIGYENPTSAVRENPYNPSSEKRIENELHVILEGKPHPTSSNVVVPVAIVCSLIGVAIIVGLCVTARKHSKKTKKAKKCETQQKVKTTTSSKDDDTNGLPEAVPLQVVVTDESGGISSA